MHLGVCVTDLTKRSLAYRSVEIEMKKIDFTVKVNGFRKAASHISSQMATNERTNEHRMGGWSMPLRMRPGKTKTVRFGMCTEQQHKSFVSRNGNGRDEVDLCNHDPIGVRCLCLSSSEIVASLMEKTGQAATKQSTVALCRPSADCVAQESIS